MITQDIKKKNQNQSKTKYFKTSNFSTKKKEATSRAKANIFPHFLPSVLDNFNRTTPWFEVVIGQCPSKSSHPWIDGHCTQQIRLEYWISTPY